VSPNYCASRTGGQHNRCAARPARRSAHPWIAQVAAHHTADDRADGQGRVEAFAGQARPKPDGPEIQWPTIGIDTNILLRHWLNDDPAPNQRIDALLAVHGSMSG
jgi:hypothetical protein